MKVFFILLIVKEIGGENLLIRDFLKYLVLKY